MMADPQEIKDEIRTPPNRKSAAREAQSVSAEGTFGDLKERGVAPQSRNLDFLLDVPLQVTVELGRTKLIINDLLKLNQGSVIELSQLLDEPMDVLINGKLVARGEVVVANERFAIRITDIVSPAERIESLK